MFKRKKINTSVLISMGKVGIYKLTSSENIRVWKELLEKTAAPLPKDYFKLLLLTLSEITLETGRPVKMTDKTYSLLTDSDSDNIAKAIINDWRATNDPTDNLLRSIENDFDDDNIGLLYFIGHYDLIQASNRSAFGKIAGFSKKSFDYYSKSMKLYKQVENSLHACSVDADNPDSSSPIALDKPSVGNEQHPFENYLVAFKGSMKGMTKGFELFCEYSRTAHAALMEINQETKKTSEETRKYSKINLIISIAVLILSVLSIMLSIYVSYRSSQSDTKNFDRLIESLQAHDASE
ncbi:MAG: hypothetical protein RBS43_10250 [Candidatus Cloacimonas sp.]|nr:hypothetical protein [Candidatus Cloacimonas sp.]